MAVDADALDISRQVPKRKPALVEQREDEDYLERMARDAQVDPNTLPDWSQVKS